MHHLITTVINQFTQIGLSYTERQVFYAACRAWLPAPVRATINRLSWLPFTLPAPFPSARFWPSLDAWLATHGHPSGLLHNNLPTQPAAALDEREFDLDRYTLPRLLICQSAPIAAMLRANAATLEFGCPVLAAAECQPLPERIAVGLARAPAAQALLLHDASLDGLRLAGILSGQLPLNVRIKPVGLRPADARRLHLFTQRLPAPPPSDPVKRDLPAADMRWLRGGRIAEVAAVPPFILLRALRRASSGVVGDASPGAQIRRLPRTGFMSWPHA